ncbi:hypothetical protein [Macrococcus carouselicus]|uniref:hypothetical protein n=1 Tax=Macrococcus carouselicus TaxID=69969 RepID=UPI00140E4C71|nr:hypothetical protein [Macrococcus carouselicus]
MIEVSADQKKPEFESRKIPASRYLIFEAADTDSRALSGDIQAGYLSEIWIPVE